MRTVLLISYLTFQIASASLANPGNGSKPQGLARYTLRLPDFDWNTTSSEHFRIHYLPGSVAEKQIDTLLERNEGYLRAQLDVLQADDFGKVIDVFYFNSRDQIKTVVNKPFRALADAASLTMLAVRNQTEVGRDAHEIMHVVSYDLWGEWEQRNELAWLGEGLATYADEPCNGHPMSELAAHILLNTEDAAPLDSLALRFRDYPEMVGYPLMASFVEFIIDVYGVETLRQLWIRAYDGLESVMGKDAALIETEWHEYLLGKWPNPEVSDWPELKQTGCQW